MQIRKNAVASNLNGLPPIFDELLKLQPNTSPFIFSPFSCLCPQNVYSIGEGLCSNKPQFHSVRNILQDSCKTFNRPLILRCTNMTLLYVCKIVDKVVHRSSRVRKKLLQYSRKSNMCKYTTSVFQLCRLNARISLRK